MNEVKFESLPHKVPADLKKIFAEDKKTAAAWQDITPLAKNEWICWIESVKLPETRLRHLQRIRQDLKAGKRRPCCWIGCPHRKK